MILVVNAENRRRFESELAQMHRQRKRIFVDGAGWSVPVIGEFEIDQYDRKDTVYLIAKELPYGPVLASVRLLTTTGPHLMSALFDEQDQEFLPRGPTVWEASRFCTAPDIHGPHRRHALLWEVICGVMEVGLLYGIDEVIFAANRSLLPLALHCGWEARTLGPSLRDEDDEVTAAAAAITAEGLRTLRERHTLPIPVTRLPVNVPLPPYGPPEPPEPLSRGPISPERGAWRRRFEAIRPTRGADRHG